MKVNTAAAVAVLAVVLLSLIAPDGASAHITVRPAFVDAGVETSIELQVPNERAPQQTVEVEATLPPGIDVVSATAPPGWSATVAGSTARWSGGRLTRRQVVSLPLRVIARVRAGSYEIRSRQRYSDGGAVRWNVTLAVLPASGEAAPAEHLWRAVLAGVVGAIVIVASLLLLRGQRRRAAASP